MKTQHSFLTLPRDQVLEEGWVKQASCDIVYVTSSINLNTHFETRKWPQPEGSGQGQWSCQGSWRVSSIMSQTSFPWYCICQRCYENSTLISNLPSKQVLKEGQVKQAFCDILYVTASMNLNIHFETQKWPQPEGIGRGQQSCQGSWWLVSSIMSQTSFPWYCICQCWYENTTLILNFPSKQVLKEV